MSPTTSTYYRLVIVAKPQTAIWLVDDCWHLVQKGVGTLETSVRRGRYFIEMGSPAPIGVAYPIELYSDLRLTQEMLEDGPGCERRSPIMLEDE